MDIPQLLQLVITSYFAGERNEMILIISTAIAASIVTIYLSSRIPSPLIRALNITVISAALLLAITALSLLIRDAAIQENLLSGLSTEQILLLLSAELQRINVIIDKYHVYRYISALLAIMSLLGVCISRHRYVHGVAAGLLLLVIAQLTIDHYSENRALRYQQALTQLLYSLQATSN